MMRGAWCVVALGTGLSCGGKKADQKPAPVPPPAPLPTAGLAGQRVALTPLELVGAEDTLHWDALFADRRATLNKCDSIIATLLGARAPEVSWVGPPRAAAHRATWSRHCGGPRSDGDVLLASRESHRRPGSPSVPAADVAGPGWRALCADPRRTRVPRPAGPPPDQSASRHRGAVHDHGRHASR